MNTDRQVLENIERMVISIGRDLDGVKKKVDDIESRVGTYSSSVFDNNLFGKINTLSSDLNDLKRMVRNLE